MHSDFVVLGMLFIVFIALPLFLIFVIKCRRQYLLNNNVYSNSRLEIVTVILGLITILPIVIFSVRETRIHEQDRIAVVKLINSFPANSVLYVNGYPEALSIEMLNALKSVTPYKQHHSHQEKTFQIELKSKTQYILLTLGRDSQNAQEYWVSSDPLFSNGGLGHIETKAFNLY